MRQRAIIIGTVLFALVLMPAAADWQTDIGINIPYYIGVGNIGEDDDDAGQMLDYAFVVPDIRVQYYFGTDLLHFGPGVRGFTAILETLAYPIFSVESEIGKFVFNAHIGGGAFLLFGLYNNLVTEGIILPEISAAYQLTERFSIGTGALFFTNASSDVDSDAFAYIGTVFARFTF